VRDALTTARGDLFLASAYLGCTGRELDGYIRASEGLQAFAGAIEKVKVDEAYAKMSTEQFEDRLETLTRNYKLEAIDIIHGMATMPFDNAAMADVKLKAAVQLRGVNIETVKNNDQGNIMAELNLLYQTAAPRIKSVRAVQIEFEQGQPALIVESGI
jgi:hypothetical protein